MQVCLFVLTVSLYVMPQEQCNFHIELKKVNEYGIKNKQGQLTLWVFSLHNVAPETLAKPTQEIFVYIA